MTHQPTVSIIGLGRIGQALAGNLARAGRAFYATDIDEEKAVELSKSWNGRATIKELDAALEAGDIIILSILFPDIKKFIVDNSDKIRGKIIIDPSNPLIISSEGQFLKAIPEGQSSGLIHKAVMPPGTPLVKAFCSLSFTSLATESFRTPDPVAALYATDDREADQPVEDLITDLGFSPLRLGSMDMAIRMEIFGDLNGVMIDGRLPSKDELKKLI